jgi:hypothetical protein
MRRERAGVSPLGFGTWASAAQLSLRAVSRTQTRFPFPAPVKDLEDRAHSP